MPETALPDYEVFALRYAHLERTRGQNFIEYDPHDGPMPMDYFVWVVRLGQRIWLVDTGFGQEAAERRGRKLLRCPIDALNVLGIEASQVQDVILTHLHYDHAGNLPKLPNARFHLQERELHYATGRFMRYPFLRHAFDVDDVTEVVRRVYADRVCFYLGDAELAPGLTLIKVGGHTDGLQAVRVHTARGWVVLASDASHYYANINQGSPFPIVFNLGDMLEGYERLRSLADSDDHLVPGHDPLVRERYPFHGDAGDDCVALHLAPQPA
ncbi:MAG: N-acyl homoserine lactonase family protein [Burkholderiaceae bacterium]